MIKNITGGTNMAFCRNCGNKLLDSDKFCPECGTPIKVSIEKEKEKELKAKEEIKEEAKEEAKEIEQVEEKEKEEAVTQIEEEVAKQEEDLKINTLATKFEFDVTLEEVINYAIQQNGGHIVRDVCIKNNSNEDIDKVYLKIKSDNELIENFEMELSKVRAGEELHLKENQIKLKLNGNYLATLTERVTCNITSTIVYMNKEIVSDCKEVVALAFDQWSGFTYTPELLAAFSMPNHPVITSLIQLASNYLDKWTGDASLAGYQYNDLNRIKQMAAAAYAAIQEKNITYANPPSSFESFGQRIRLADAVIEQHMGTCLDMTLLYVACLEAMGLNPIIVMMKGHVFAGVWLVENSFSNTIMDDPSHLEKRMSTGINELIVVECTAMNKGDLCDFDKAIQMAQKSVANYSDFEFVIDIARARSMGIRPLPVRVMTANGFEVLHENRKEKDIIGEPTRLGESIDFDKISIKEEVTKQLQWERKLLDLSLRNMLINFRFTKAVVPLLCSDIGILEDALSDGEEFSVLPRPDNMDIKGETVTVEALTNLGEFKDYIELESKHKKLHSFYNEKELGNYLTKMYRSAKSSLEENGASTLYLALGLLRWSDGNRQDEMRYAPIILLPIDIARKSANKGYSMRMRDEDAQINITLLEFLKQNYGIQINGVNPLPVDEHGLDLPKIFAIVRNAIMSLSMWDVLEVGFIGNFSFSQFVMWNDMHNHSDILEKNKIVRSLVKGAIDWDCTIPENVQNDEAYLPITADASQLRAINMAANEVSFVLHGPPGTGKSQTITAMIANALTKGKRVLFVAEKMAALQVVQKRLEALGIGDFCLELHSNKATKKAVLDQLKKNLEISAYGNQTDYNQKIEDIKNMRSNLDAYAIKLHQKREFGMSLKELIDLYETTPDYNKELRFTYEYVKNLTQKDLDNHRRLLEQLVATGRALGHPNGHPLSSVRQSEYTQNLRMDLTQTVSEYKNELSKYKTEVEKFINLMNISEPVTKEEWEKIYEGAKSVIHINDIPTILINADNLEKEFDLPLAFLEEKESFAEKNTELISKWKESFLGMDMQMYRTKYDEANQKFLGKSKAINNLLNELQSFCTGKITIEQVPVIIADIQMYQKSKNELDEKGNRISFEWKQLIEKYPTAKELKEYKQNVSLQLDIAKQYIEQIKKLEQEGSLLECMDNANNVISAYETMLEKENKVDDLLMLEATSNEENWIEYKEELCDKLLSNASVIKDWIVYRQFDELCKKEGLDVVCAEYAQGLEHEQVLGVYTRSIYKAIILSVIENEPVLNKFTGNGFNEQIVQFKKLDDEFMELTKQEMYYKLTHNLPTSNDSVEISKELNILRRAISSNGRGISIRSLFDQIPNVLSRLTPCMLMSPISVAQYLSTDNEGVDIVIFDEASQLPTCKAVGVLARGKNAVIVGDPNQMPPTSFFAGNSIDEDNLDIEDLDSVLDDCLALGMPSAHLKWHYRSRHESLIAFSNREFYENSMLTFPSVNDRERRVSMVKVDGFFNRKKGRINEGEAKAIVEEIKRRYKDEERSKQSIGVVTFNISQQTLIEDMLQEEYSKDIDFDNWANLRENELFVKNLENVQGDERDVILFSVAFGPDEEGKLSLNFGPLNKEGGWKRLNVAVSRARCEMMVFSTMTADMIDLKRTKSKGVEALKSFLEFAYSGKLQASYDEVQFAKKKGIIDAICKVLDEKGYKYQNAVGHSKFKVDIAVVNPQNEDEYILGIMLDGESYRQSESTKDREIAQISVLKGLGWRIHRIWTMDWWDNKQKEIENLLQVLMQS